VKSYSVWSAYEEQREVLQSRSLWRPALSRGSPLAGRLANNAAALLELIAKIAKAIDEGRTITRPQNG